MEDLQDRLYICSNLLHSLSGRLDRLSDVQNLPFNSAELHTVRESLMALHGVLAGADAVLALEVKRWGL